jgi:hypothetical protein
MSRMARLLSHLALLTIRLVTLDLPLRSIAQENWITYTKDDGLVAEYFISIVVDSDNAVWGGTLSGSWTAFTPTQARCARGGLKNPHPKSLSHKVGEGPGLPLAHAVEREPGGGKNAAKMAFAAPQPPLG